MSQDTNAAVNEPVVTQDATPTDSAPVETNVPEVAEKSDFAKALLDDDSPTKAETEADTAEPEPTGEDQQDTEETQTEEQPLGKADERKQQLNSEIRDLVAQRNAIKQEVEKLNSEAYQAPTPEDLMGQVNPETGEYYNPIEAKLAAMEQRQELERYNTQVADSQLTLEHESSKVMQDFPIFNPETPDYKPEVATKAAELMKANLIHDQNTGQVIGSHVSPYQLYSTIAAAVESSRTEGQIQGQRNTEKMLANADTTPSTVPQKKAEDPFKKGFWSED